jgi:dTDP-4-dehydrorhamnose 3,5-epimerase
MIVRSSSLPDVLIIEPRVFDDLRGSFFEAFNQQSFERAGLTSIFVQDNQSISLRHVIRGLHYQIRQPQGKLVRAVAGEIWDVAVDLRRSSATFGHWCAEILSSENKRSIWIPPGFAHGFLVLSDKAEVLYKVTDFYAPEHERVLLWNDPFLNIPWPLQVPPVLGMKDAKGRLFRDSEYFA